MQNMCQHPNPEKILDENLFENFSTYINYKSFFEQMELQKWNEEKRRSYYRELCLKDLYFLVRYAMDRSDVNREYTYNFAQIVQRYENDVLFLCARGHYKSTFITFGKTIQRILNDPNSTTCIFSVTNVTANPFLRQISDEFKKNEFLRYLFPEIIPPANSDLLGKERIEVLRSTTKKEATVESYGVTTNMPTGKHFDHTIYDDLVTPETAQNPEILTSTYEKYRMSLNCTAETFTQIVVGTPYHYNDTYAELRKDPSFTKIIMPAEVDGVPQFMTREELDRRKERMGNYVYNSQMLLDPTPSDQAFFNIEHLVYHREEGYIDPDKRINPKMFVVLDPSISEKKNSDYCVGMAIEVFHFGEGQFVLPYMEVMEYFSIKEGNKNPTLILNKLIDLCLKYNVNKPIIETVAYQKVLIYRFNEIMQERGLRLFVDEYYPDSNKQVRIKALDPIVNFGRLTIKRGMKEVEEQLQRFPYGHDDHVDCISTVYSKIPILRSAKRPKNNVDRSQIPEYNSVKMLHKNSNKVERQNYRREYYNGERPTTSWRRFS